MSTHISEIEGFKLDEIVPFLAQHGIVIAASLPSTAKGGDSRAQDGKDAINQPHILQLRALTATQAALAAVAIDPMKVTSLLEAERGNYTGWEQAKALHESILQAVALRELQPLRAWLSIEDSSGNVYDREVALHDIDASMIGDLYEATFHRDTIIDWLNSNWVQAEHVESSKGTTESSSDGSVWEEIATYIRERDEWKEKAIHLTEEMEKLRADTVRSNTPNGVQAGDEDASQVDGVKVFLPHMTNDLREIFKIMWDNWRNVDLRRLPKQVNIAKELDKALGWNTNKNGEPSRNAKIIAKVIRPDTLGDTD